MAKKTEEQVETTEEEQKAPKADEVQQETSETADEAPENTEEAPKAELKVPSIDTLIKVMDSDDPLAGLVKIHADLSGVDLNKLPFDRLVEFANLREQYTDLVKEQQKAWDVFSHAGLQVQNEDQYIATVSIEKTPATANVMADYMRALQELEKLEETLREITEGYNTQIEELEQARDGEIGSVKKGEHAADVISRIETHYNAKLKALATKRDNELKKASKDVKYNAQVGKLLLDLGHAMLGTKEHAERSKPASKRSSPVKFERGHYHTTSYGGADLFYDGPNDWRIETHDHGVIDSTTYPELTVTSKSTAANILSEFANRGDNGVKLAMETGKWPSRSGPQVWGEHPVE